MSPSSSRAGLIAIGLRERLQDQIALELLEIQSVGRQHEAMPIGVVVPQREVSEREGAHSFVGEQHRPLHRIPQRLSEMEASYAVIEAADAAVTSAREARRAVNERFQAGVATSTLVLDADVALLQAERDRTRAVAQARIDEADLQRTLGELPPTGAVAAAASSRGDAAP